MSWNKSDLECQSQCWGCNLPWSHFNTSQSHLGNSNNMSLSKFMLMKLLSHPGHGDSKCCILGNWTCFSFLKMSKTLLEFRTEDASWVRGETSSRNWNKSAHLQYITENVNSFITSDLIRSNIVLMFSLQDVPGGGTDQSPDQGPPAEWHVPEDGESRPLSSVGGGTRTESCDQVEIPSVEGYNQFYIHTGLQDRGSHGRSKELDIPAPLKPQIIQVF